MVLLLLPLLCLAGVPAGCDASPVPAGESYLYQPEFCFDDVLRCPAVPYQPQPGDLFFASDNNKVMVWGHWLAGAYCPHHSGIVVARCDGRLAVMEAGPFNTVVVEVVDVFQHLQSYVDNGDRVWIRRRKVPLTCEESARLTAWAELQDQKRFASLRMAAQLTPFRSRGPLRSYVVGKPHGNRCSFFCSELVTESLVAAGLFDPDQARPPATYPRDLFFDHSPNPYLNKHLCPHLAAFWEPPARWTSCPVTPDAVPVVVP